MNMAQKQLFEYWRNVSDESRPPTPDKIDPLAFDPKALPFLVLEEVDPTSGRLRTRLTGTAYRDAVGYEGTHLRTDEIRGGAAAANRLAWLVATRQPYWYRGPCTFSLRPWLPFSVLALPFSPPGDGVSRVLCVFDFAPEPA